MGTSLKVNSIPTYLNLSNSNNKKLKCLFLVICIFFFIILGSSACTLTIMRSCPWKESGLASWEPSMQQGQSTFILYFESIKIIWAQDTQGMHSLLKCSNILQQVTYIPAFLLQSVHKHYCNIKCKIFP